STHTSSPPPAHLDKHLMSEKLETVIFQLRQVTRERDDLRKRLALSSPGTTFDDCRPSVKPGHDCERLKLQCMKAMSDLQSLQNQHTKTLKRCEEAVRDADYYHTASLSLCVQELNSALLDRDRAIREKTELLEKYCHEVQDKAETQKELSQACKDIEMVREERDVARKERTEAIIQRDQLLREYYQARQKQDSATLDMERVSKELEVLRKQCEAVSEELQESVQEAEVAKCRRDWAFQERDKIVAERESIRTLCDKLRRERDRAVSDLADALRNLDDLRKQKNDAVRELKELNHLLFYLPGACSVRLAQYISVIYILRCFNFLWQINGISLDNKSVSECENLLRSCRDSVSLSLLKFFPQSLSGQSIAESQRDCERNSSADHLRPCRKQPTHKDMYSPTHDVESERGQRGTLYRSENYCPHPASKRALTFHPVSPGDCMTVEMSQERRCIPQKQSSGTWPKMVAVAMTTAESIPPLSIFKTPKKRKSIFDADVFKRPETPSKLDYLSLSQMPKHSPQNPPEPPKRSDSFKFKHRAQGSSASDSTITTGSPPATPIQTTPGDKTSPDFENQDRNGNVLQRQGSGGGGGGTSAEEVPGQGADDLEMRRGRPKSAPAQRRSLTPLKMPFSQVLEALTLSVLEHSPQHQGRWSVDLNHKRSAELFDGSRGSVQHNTNSLPSSARQGLYATRTHAHTHTHTHTRTAISYLLMFCRSLSHSDCSSPSLITPPLSPLDAASFTSSQSQGSISAQTRLSVSPVPIDRRRDRPYIEEPRCVTIPKGAEPLGISIVGGENGGIFVSKVTGGSIAQKHHLEFGDQLLEFNGINLRNATEQQARLIIGQQCDTITILAQYNPHMHQLGNHSRSSSRMESSVSSHSTPDTHSNIDTLSEQDEGTMTPPSKQATPTVLQKVLQAMPELRLVVLRKTPVDLGLKICGGNLTGVFVEALEEDSPARGADGLQPGDLILECNSVSLKKKTAEEVYLEMLKPSENVTLRVQYRPEHFRRVKDAPADGFYIRALFDHVGDLEQELSFKKDDILYVDDTLPGGSLGYWLAWQLDENAQKLVRGHVPSKCMMDQDSQRRYSVTDGKDDSGSGKTLSAAARRSFFRRKLKHKRSSSKDGRDAPAADALSTDSMPFMDDCLSPAYQRVLKVESTNRRPVLILGPLVEPIKDMLLREAPGKYCRCLPEGMKATQQAIERGVKDCLFIDYKRRSGHFDVMTVASIKEITEKDCHCLLDIAPYAIERLHIVNIYPIVIFIRYRNAKQIKEQKDPVYLRDKVSQKHSKEQFESAQRIEQDYSKYFTGVVPAGSLSNICSQIMAIVDQEQNKVLWIPDGSM
uniref:Discs large MAGUK scaffold protein 5 n=1 Tax=Cyprinus carpio TaxID=7962 RepID=A0A8C2HGJ1_CYPCA